MNKPPLLSVFVTNYNYGAFIEASLTAILSQSRPPDELVVVDDGSTDGSPELIEAMARQHPTLRLIRHERNKGVYAALETAFAAVSGKYLATLAADDPLLPGHFESALALLEAHPEAGLSSSDYVFLNPDGQLRPVRLGIVDQPSYVSPQAYRRLLRERRELSLPTSTAVWRREVLVDTGYKCWDLKWHHDWMAGHVAALRHGVCYVPRVAQVVRLDAGSTSMSGMRSGAPYDEVLRAMLRLVATEPFADVRDGFGLPGLLSRFGVRLLRLLTENPVHHRLLTRELLIAVVKHEAWLDCAIEEIAARAQTQAQLVEITRALLRSIAESCRAQARDLLEMGDGRGAGVEHIRRALMAEPSAAVGMKMASDFILLGKIDDAAAACESYCASYVDGQGPPADVYLARGLMAWRKGERDAAEAVLREGLERAPSVLHCIMLDGLLEQQSRWADAEAVLSEGLAAFPEAVALHRLMGLLHLRRGQLQAALPLVYAAYVRDPSDVPAVLALAQICEADGLLPESLQFFRSAVVLDPRNWEALSGLTRLHQRLGDAQASKVLQGTFRYARLDEIAAGLKSRTGGP